MPPRKTINKPKSKNIPRSPKKVAAVSDTPQEIKPAGTPAAEVKNIPAPPTAVIPAKLSPKKLPKKLSRKILLIISIFAIVAGVIITIYPFWPDIQYSLFPPKINANISAANANNTNSASVDPQIITHKQVPAGNKLFIPKIGVAMKIVDGANEKIALNQGAWRMPQTSTPDLGGNTVLTGHRFKYRPPSKETFYLLDKLSTGDQIIVNWEGLEYNYQVIGTKIVEPTAVEVLNPTLSPQLTLITCTPLFTTRQRLIIMAELVQ